MFRVDLIMPATSHLCIVSSCCFYGRVWRRKVTKLVNETDNFVHTKLMVTSRDQCSTFLVETVMCLLWIDV